MLSFRFLAESVVVLLVTTPASLTLAKDRTEATFSKRTFVSHRLGFSYRLPEGYEAFRCCSWVMSTGEEPVMRTFKRSTSAQLVVTARKVGASEWNCKRWVINYEKDLPGPRQQGTVLLGKATKTRIADRSFWRVDFQDVGKAFHSYLCTERRGFWVYWSIDAASSDDRDELIASLDKIIFDEVADTPVPGNK
jgi:hypothetical protein